MFSLLNGFARRYAQHILKRFTLSFFKSNCKSIVRFKNKGLCGFCLLYISLQLEACEKVLYAYRVYNSFIMSEEIKEGAVEEESVDLIQQQINAMTSDQKDQALYGFMRIWELFDEETKHILGGLGKWCSIILRNYSRVTGMLLAVSFEPKSMRFGVEERLFDPKVQGYVNEIKAKTVFCANMIGYEIDIDTTLADIDEAV